MPLIHTDTIEKLIEEVISVSHPRMSSWVSLRNYHEGNNIRRQLQYLSDQMRNLS